MDRRRLWIVGDKPDHDVRQLPIGPQGRFVVEFDPTFVSEPGPIRGNGYGLVEGEPQSQIAPRTRTLRREPLFWKEPRQGQHA